MKLWFKSYPALFEEIRNALKSDLNYCESYSNYSNLFVSVGDINVHYNGKKKFPIIIVYPNATPFQLPSFYMVQSIPELEVLNEITKAVELSQVDTLLKSHIKFYFHRHQNYNGTLCILENDSLDKGFELFDTKSILNRIKEWCKSTITKVFQHDNNEIELYAHYPYKENKKTFFYTNNLLNSSGHEGLFFGEAINYGSSNSNVFFDTYVASFNSGIMITSNLNTNISVLFKDKTECTKREKIKLAQKNERLIKGKWFDINSEPTIFSNYKELITLIGNGDLTLGFNRFYSLDEKIEETPDIIYIGLRYLNYRKKQEFILFQAKRKPDLGFEYNSSIDGNSVFFEAYESFEVIKTEEFSEEKFFLRNQNRIDSNVLSKSSIQVIGCGALGGEIIDILAKAGTKEIGLVDKDIYKFENKVRHILDISAVGKPKVIAFHEYLRDNFPFVIPLYSHNNLDVFKGNLFNGRGFSFSISTIADDNAESYVNTQALESNQIVFYARALRGGKAARIFRVIPKKDACFNCLTCYREEGDKSFVDVPDDESLPTIMNECNNPIRPGSAADLKTISAITGKILINQLQGGFKSEDNHWIFSSEKEAYGNIVESLDMEVKSSTLKPHKNCIFCNPPKLEIEIDSKCVDFMKNEISKNTKIETGGILVGTYKAPNLIEIKDCSMPGPNAVMTLTKFERDTGFCQHFLDMHKNAFVYLGEWHYHPSLDSNPSQTDIKSMLEIAMSPNYGTENPISIIVTSDGNPHCTVHPKNDNFYNVNLQIK